MNMQLFIQPGLILWVNLIINNIYNHINCINSNLVLNCEDKSQRFISPTEKGEQITTTAVTADKHYMAIAQKNSFSQKGPTVIVYDLISLRRRKVLSPLPGLVAKVIKYCF